MALVIIYVILGYWATGQTIYKNKILIRSSTDAPIFFERLLWAIFMGWLLIPVGIIRAIFHI